jgi:dienelactone hydrolase
MPTVATTATVGPWPRKRAALVLGIAAFAAIAGSAAVQARPASRAGRTVTAITPAAHDVVPVPADTAVGLRVVTLIDRSRRVHFGNGTVEPRTLVTQVRYPAVGAPGADDVADAPPLLADGPYPLVIFGHGFAETPTVYARLLDSWARAGYVVAAPLFPLTQKYVPGGRRDDDLINQPADMSFVITRMLARSDRPTGFFHGLLADDLIAVSGQSDGAATALAEAYDPVFRDPRVRAAIILSGAYVDPLGGHFSFPAQGPALLAAQGSADPINEPSATSEYYEAAPRPKFLLSLVGATHLPPYTTQEPYLGIVERVTVAFLDHFLRHQHASLERMRADGEVAGSATLTG